MIAHPHTQIVLDSINKVFNCCPTVIKNDLINHISIKEVKKDKVFIHHGEPCQGIYIIAAGSAKLFVNKEKQNQVFLFKALNDIIGIEAAMQKSNYKYSASAMEDLILAYIPTDQIEKILTTYPNAFFSLMKKVNEKADAIESRSSLMMTDSAEKVVIKTIEDLRNHFGTDKDNYLNIHIPVRDLASYICMSKTNLYRVLHDLKERKILTHHLDRYRLESKSMSAY